MGEVYLAHDPHIDRKVALKVLHKKHLSDKMIIKRFAKEAKAIGRLAHPDIIGVYDVGLDHGTIYIAMEYVEGKPLNEVMKSRKLDMTTIVKICRQVAVALDYAHKQGIVHRDIKPSNLMITDNCQVKLTDFGIARFNDASLTRQTHMGDVLGTPAYMSPEQIDGEPIDHRSDLFSLGVILYELVVGQRPFIGDKISAVLNAITQQRFIPPKKENPSISSDLNTLILKCMDNNPDRRYQSGAELAKDLSAHLPNEKTDSKLLKSARRYKRFVWLAILMAAGALCWQGYHYMTANQPVTALVSISSDPSNASIYLDNTLKGKTPMRCEVPLGIYDIRLTLTGHYESEAQIDVNESGEIPVHLRLLPKE
jgi:serine/threonine protein kinase